MKPSLSIWKSGLTGINGNFILGGRKMGIQKRICIRLAVDCRQIICLRKKAAALRRRLMMKISRERIK